MSDREAVPRPMADKAADVAKALADKAADVAKALEARKGFKFAAAYVWGTAPFRPYDSVYELLGATADGDRVDIRPLDTSASPEAEVIIAIYSPGKVKATEDAVRVTSAARVLFGSSFEAVAEGESYRVTWDGQPGDSFSRAGESALRLLISPFDSLESSLRGAQGLSARRRGWPQ